MKRLLPATFRIIFFSLLPAVTVEFGPRLTAAEVGHWVAAEPPKAQGIELEAASDSDWRIEKVDSHLVARLKPSSDYYSRAAYHLSFKPRKEKQQLWLILEFLDRGYGLIGVSPVVGDTKEWGIARVNSGALRRAVFEYTQLPQKVRVQGLDYLHAAILTDQQPPIEQAPLLESGLKFAVPSERVTTAAGNGNGPEHLADILAGMRNSLPLVRAMGFNGVESYIRWGWVETKPGIYDWSYYDALLDEIQKHGLQWFPMIMAGSGYALPKWFHDSTNNFGFKCLEHGIVHDTQSIFDPHQAEYASRFVAEFGKHYSACKGLLGIRLGPSGDYGEAQYPAQGPGYGFRHGHTHIGYWAADRLAQEDFRRFLTQKYQQPERLNAVWQSQYTSFDQITTFLPDTAMTRRMRVDFADWYMGAMSKWCEQWAIWSRQALPNTVIHQSSGGWGPVEIGTDYSYQAKSMSKVHGGMRLTNEGDDFADNFTITRMASSAARFYGIPLGYEPGGFGSKRGVMARLFNAVTTGAVHLFYYLGNLTDNDQALEAWMKYAPSLDQRAKPLIDVAAFYPDAAVKLDDEVLRYRWASTFFTVARTLRETVDFDYASEQMVIDGALDRYKVLLFIWGSVTEKPVLERIDRWVKDGGTLVFATRPRGLPQTVEADTSVAQRWLAGETGKGRVIQWRGDLIPSQSYAEFVRDLMLKTPSVRQEIRQALNMEKPAGVFWSVLENGKMALLNFSNHPATVRLASGKSLTIPPYEMAME